MTENSDYQEQWQEMRDYKMILAHQYYSEWDYKDKLMPLCFCQNLLTCIPGKQTSWLLVKDCHMLPVFIHHCEAPVILTSSHQRLSNHHKWREVQKLQSLWNSPYPCQYEDRDFQLFDNQDKSTLQGKFVINFLTKVLQLPYCSWQAEHLE